MWHIYKPQLIKWIFIPYIIYVALLIYLSVTFNGDFLDGILKKEEANKDVAQKGKEKHHIDYDEFRANVEGNGEILALLMPCFVLWLYFARVECG